MTLLDYQCKVPPDQEEINIREGPGRRLKEVGRDRDPPTGCTYHSRPEETGVRNPTQVRYPP